MMHTVAYQLFSYPTILLFMLSWSGQLDLVGVLRPLENFISFSPYCLSSALGEIVQHRVRTRVDQPTLDSPPFLHFGTLGNVTF